MSDNSKKMIKIDGEKLKSALRKKKVSSTTASTELGYSKGYLSVCMGTEQISKVATIAIDQMYGIPLSEYEKTTSRYTGASDIAVAELIEKVNLLDTKLEVVLDKLQKIQGKLFDNQVANDKLKNINKPINAPAIKIEGRG